MKDKITKVLEVSEKLEMVVAFDAENEEMVNQTIIEAIAELESIKQ